MICLGRQEFAKSTDPHTIKSFIHLLKDSCNVEKFIHNFFFCDQNQCKLITSYISANLTLIWVLVAQKSPLTQQQRRVYQDGKLVSGQPQFQLLFPL